MSRILMIMMGTLVVGCETTQPQVRQPVAESKTGVIQCPKGVDALKEPTLYELTDAYEERRPVKGGIYQNDSRRIKIFQVCTEVDEKTKEETQYVLARGDDLIIAVINKRDYVEDEYLLPGKYCYCGPFQYQTAPIVQGVKTTGMKTVRLFMEVTDREAQKIEEQMKTENGNDQIGNAQGQEPLH